MNAVTSFDTAQLRQASGSEKLLQALLRPGPITIPTCLVVAHPDDETIALGGSMVRFTQLTVIHLTDGAPRQLPHGLTGEQVARTRLVETREALRAALADPVREVRYHFTDGALDENLAATIDRLAEDLILSEAVITHAYEGGHIDHDISRLAVHAASERLQNLICKSPEVVEFGGGFSRRGRPCADGFSNDYKAESHKIVLTPAARQRREMAMACHRSQAGQLKLFTGACEWFRATPDYDFTRPLLEVLYSAAERSRFMKAVHQSCCQS